MKTNTIPHKISIIGAGILGLCCAHILTKRFGQKNVHIFDLANFPPENASHMAGGMISPYSELDHMPLRFLPAGEASILFWRELSESSSNAFSFYENGSMLLAHENDRHLLQRFQSLLPSDLNFKKLDRREISALEPSFTETGFADGFFMPNESHLDPQKLMAYLCNKTENKITKDITPEIEAQNADWVIDCRGMGAANDDQKLRGVKGEILIVHNPEFTLSRPIRLMHPRYPLYIVPRDKNIFMIGATILEGSGKSGVSLRSGMELMSALYTLHPSFADAEIISIKSGIRPAYPDNLPHIYRNERIIRCNGLFRHGYLLSPIIARCVESIIMDEHCAFTELFLKEKENEHHPERKRSHG